jgi:hypothetical protein
MAEQETIVRWDRESDTLTVYTHSKTAVRKLCALGAKFKYEQLGGTCLEMPKTWFKWPRPRRKGGKGNAEALAKGRQNAQEGRKAKAQEVNQHLTGENA